MTDPAPTLLAVAILSSSALGVFAWRVMRIDPAEPARLVGELRFSQWAALVLAAVGGTWVGAGVRESSTVVGFEVMLGTATIVCAGWSMVRETRPSLLLLCLGFVAHAFLDIAHRPGWLSETIVPHWFAVGCALYNAVLAALCFSLQRR